MKRILLKISGEALMGKSNFGIDVSTINKISNEIESNADYSELGILLIVVILLTLLVPVISVIIIQNSKFKTQE